VVGILLAFGIQAWWEGRIEAGQRDALLASLASDFELAEIDLVRVRGYYELGAAACATLLQLPTSQTLSRDVGPRVDSLLSYAAYGGSFDPPDGTISAVLGSGNLDVLESQLLASELTAWPGRLSDLRRTEESVSRGVRSLRDYLSESGIDVSNLVWDDTTQVPWRVTHAAAFELVTEPRLRSIVSSLWWSYRKALVSRMCWQNRWRASGNWFPVTGLRSNSELLLRG
jgi:hypothetical protein